MGEYKRLHADLFFNEYINEDVANDISKLLDTISSGYTIKNITHSIHNIVKIDEAFFVVIEVKCCDYAIRKKRKGYFAIEYIFLI